MNALSFANGQMIFQGLMATDYGRFADKNIRYRGTATIMLLELIPMFTVIFLGCFLGASLLGELTGPDAQSQAQDPGFMFVHLMGLVGVLFVIITQIRINVMNLYGGSIALASGFEVAAHFKPGRPWFMFFVWFFGVVFYATNVIDHLGTFLAITGVLTNTWVLIILADYFICRRLLKLGRSRRHRVPRGRGPRAGTPAASSRSAWRSSSAPSASSRSTRSTTPRSSRCSSGRCCTSR